MTRRTPLKAALVGTVVTGGNPKGALAGVAINQRRSNNNHNQHQTMNEAAAPMTTQGGGPLTYVMREKILAIGDDFTIDKMDDAGRRHRRFANGEPAYYVDNKIIRARKTINIRSHSRFGPIQYQVQERMVRARDSMAIEDINGRKIAEIKKRVVGVVRDHFVVQIRGDQNWQVHGSILQHDYTIKDNGGRVIATVHKKWITPIKDRYFIDIAEANDDTALVLMVAIGLEALSQD